MATAIASGLGATVGFAPEGTVGTFTTPTRWLTFVSESLRYKKNIVQSQAVHGGLYLLGTRRADVTHTVDGSVNLEVYDRGLGMIFQNMLGGAPVIASGGSSTFQQLYTPTDTTGESLSVQVGRPSTDGTQNAFSYNGVKVTDWTIAVSNNSIASLALGFDGWNSVTNLSYTAPSFVASNMFQFAQATLLTGGTVVPAAATTIAVGSNAATLPQATINVASTTGFPAAGTIYVATAGGASPYVVTYTGTTGTTFTGCAGGSGAMATGGAVTSQGVSLTTPTVAATATSCTIKGTNVLNDARFYLGSLGTKAEQLVNGFRGITGSADFEFNGLTESINAFYSDAPLALELSFVGPVIGGSVHSGISILIPQIRWEGDEPNVPDANVLKYSAPFTGLDDGVNAPVQILYTTLDSTV